jgi:hypothetical protein
VRAQKGEKVNTSFPFQKATLLLSEGGVGRGREEEGEGKRLNEGEKPP